MLGTAWHVSCYTSNPQACFYGMCLDTVLYMMLQGEEEGETLHETSRANKTEQPWQPRQSYPVS